MARKTNDRVEAYLAGQLAPSEVFRNMLGATNVELVERSLHADPPHGLFGVRYSDSESKKLWCEIRGACHSDEGEGEVDQAADRECCQPSEPLEVTCEPAAVIADSVVRAIMKTPGKDPYRELLSEHGLGHLHVFLAKGHDALFGESALSSIAACLPVEDIEERAVFHSISIGWQGQVFCLWSNSSSPKRTR